MKVKFYAGGVQGDERDVSARCRLGQLSGAAITGIGLSIISPEVRALEAARTYDELDHAARAARSATAQEGSSEKGYILLGWGDVGPVHLFSQQPVRRSPICGQTKLWHVERRSAHASRLFAALGAARRADGRARGAAGAVDGRDRRLLRLAAVDAGAAVVGARQVRDLAGHRPGDRRDRDDQEGVGRDRSRRSEDRSRKGERDGGRGHEAGARGQHQGVRPAAEEERPAGGARRRSRCSAMSPSA